MPGIVVGIDGSRHAQQALEWALRYAATEKVPLKVITVHPVGISAWMGNPVSDATDRQQEELARQTAQDAVEATIKELDVHPTADVVVQAISGQPAQVLINASSGADLMVVGSRGAGGFASLLLGSVTEQLVHHAACPVVVVRH